MKKQKFDVAILNTPHHELAELKWKGKYNVVMNMLGCDFDEICTHLGHHTEKGDFNGDPWTAESATMAFNTAIRIAQIFGTMNELEFLGDDYKWQFKLMLKQMKKLNKKGGAA